MGLRNSSRGRSPQVASRAAGGGVLSFGRGFWDFSAHLPSDSPWDSHFSLSVLLDGFLDTNPSFASWALCGHQPGPHQGCAPMTVGLASAAALCPGGGGGPYRASVQALEASGT